MPSAPIANPFTVEPSAATDTTVRPKSARAKYFRRAEARRGLATGAEGKHKNQHAGDRRRHGCARRQSHGDLGLAPLRHGIAVIGGGGGGRLAWNVEQNGGDRPTEGGA